MPHQCVRCNTIYPDGASNILTGCSNCGSKFFFFIKKDVLEETKQVTFKLTNEERQQIEKDVVDLIGTKFDKEKPVVLDLESVRLGKPGQYEIDLVNLFKGRPLIYKLEEGKYIIDIISTFRMKSE